MKQAILSICVDQQNAVEIRFDGDQMMIVSMFWWIEVAKDWLLNKLKENWNIAWSDDQQELTLSKSDALWHYLKIWKKVEQRIQAINKSDQQATFQVDPDLFQNM